jgi:hypothetical protein
MKIPYKMTGWGWIKSYKGEKSRTNILEANIKMKVQGRFCRSRFTVLEETGEDLLVLGDPWLTEQNPDIDWQKRTLRFRAKPSIKEGTRAPYLRVVDSRTVQHMEAPWRDYDPKSNTITKCKRRISIPDTIQEAPTEEKKKEKIPAELNANNEIRELETKHHSKAYMEELEEIKKKLPKEIEEFADVFSSEE